MNNKLILGVLSAGIISLSACTNNKDIAAVSETQTEEQILLKKIAQLEDENSRLNGSTNDDRVEQLESQIAQLRQQQSSFDNSTSSQNNSSNLPPNPKAGECYSRVLVPAKYEMSKENVLVKAESYRIETTPSVYKNTTQKVLVQESSQQLKVIPATYKKVTEKILVSEASTKVIEVPVEYETISERILVRPGYTTWKKGKGPIQRVDNSTGEIMCLVEVPDEYKTVQRKVVKTPATTRTVEIPAKYKTITKTIVDKPATTNSIEIPAKYKEITVKTLVQAADERKFVIPAEYRMIEKKKLVADSYLEWSTILCETNTTPGVVARIQQSLSNAGHNPGAIDGVLGKDTMRAINEFQKARKLPAGQLTMQTLSSLGVSL